MSRVQLDIDGRSSRTARDAAPFAIATVAILVIIGLVGFAAAFTLTGWADDLRERDTRAEHAFSNSAVGFGALYRLLQQTGTDTGVLIEEPEFGFGSSDFELFEDYHLHDLHIITPPARYSSFAGGLDDTLPDHQPTLVVLPKWQVRPLSGTGGTSDEVEVVPVRDGLIQAGRAGWLLESWGIDLPLTRLEVRDPLFVEAPAGKRFVPLPSFASSYVEIRRPQVLDADAALDIDLEGDWSTRTELTLGGAPVMVSFTKGDTVEFVVLTEPDLLNTHGISTQTRAGLALDIVSRSEALMDTDTGAIRFDLRLHGYAGSEGLIKAVTRPPFLAATLLAVLAALLLIWRAFARFGDPRSDAIDLAPGKRTLVENGAHLIDLAGRNMSLSDDYAEVRRRRLIAGLGLKGASGDRLARALSAREGGADLGVPLDVALKQVGSAPDEGSLVRAAQALHDRTHDLLKR